MQFQFKSCKKEYDILGVNGDKLKTYYIDVGQVDTFKSVLKKFAKFKEFARRIEDENEDTDAIVDEMIECQKDIVNVLLDNDWEFLWMECQENVLMMLKFVKAIIKIANEDTDEQTRDI